MGIIQGDIGNKLCFVIIDEKVFEGLVVMTVVTIIISGPIMKYYFLKDASNYVLEPGVEA